MHTVYGHRAEADIAITHLRLVVKHAVDVLVQKVIDLRCLRQV